MDEQIQRDVIVNAGSVNIVQRVFLPSVCPLCSRGLDPSVVTAHPHNGKDLSRDCFFVVVHCGGCHEVFLCLYRPAKGTATAYSIYPQKPKPVAISAEIKRVSSRFESVLTQAEAAYSMDLVDIAGIGYRKALEVLVKDYLIHVKPDERKKIEKEGLRDCINEHLSAEYTSLIRLANKCNTLGNDFAHFLRKYEDNDIADLRRLITSALHLFTSILTAEEPLVKSRP